MYELTLKRRISIFIGVLFLIIPLACGGLYISLDSMTIYFSFPESFTFSSLVIYGFSFFLIIIPLTFLSFYPIFLGRLADINIQKKASRCIYICFFVFFIVQVGFGFYFVNELEHRGYIACRGIPSGWMPAMATKYVTHEELCSKKDP